MNNIIKRCWNQNSMVIIEDLRGMAFHAESGGHTFQISGIDGDGNPVALSGTPAGVMLRSDNQDVALTCSISDGKVNATLPANAYSVPGRFGITIFLTSDGQKTAIYAAAGTVGKTSSGTVAPPAGSDVVDLVNAIAAAVATIPASYTDLMAAVAPTYSSSGLYAVGSYAWYNGKLYRCTTAITTAETWTAAHWTPANLGSDLVDLKSAISKGVIKTTETAIEKVTGTKALIFNLGYYPVYNDGTVVDISAPVDTTTTSKSFVTAISPCSPGDKFTVNAYGGSSNRAAIGFLNANKEGIYKNYASGRVKTVITAPENAAWLIVNNTIQQETNPYAFKGANAPLQEQVDVVTEAVTDQEGNLISSEEVSEKVGNILDNILDEKDITYLLANGCIVTAVVVGETVDITVGQYESCKYIIVPCVTGERMHIYGSGYNNYRLWAITDTEYKLIAKSTAITSVTDVMIEAPCDGYFIVNIDSSKGHLIKSYSFFNGNDEDSITAVIGQGANYTETIIPVYYNEIVTNVSVGSTVDATEVYNTAWHCKTFAVEKGDQFILTGHGGNNPRLWAFTDGNYTLISKAANNARLENELLTAKNDGYLIINLNKADPWSIIKLNKVTISDAVNKMANEDLPKARSNSSTEPTVKFDIPYNMRDFTAESGACDFEPETFIPQMYSLYDALVTANPDYITKYDAALYDGLSLTYPVYANGVPAGDPTYQETPAYKTYLYKFACESIGAGHQSNCPKQKVMIVCGTHGNERFSPFVIYLMMKSLCNITDENYFKMRSAFDFYVIPVLSGYGAYHASRANGNRVNINRNYPTAGWIESDNQGSVDYTGPYGGSEFETQLVMALAGKIKPNIMIDAHNYGITGERQFYTVLNDKKMLPLMHQCLVDCSCTFIKNLPQYFGTKWQLFLEDGASSSPKTTGSTAVGTTARWFYENGVPNSATLEIAETVKFLNGEYVDYLQDHYGIIAMSIGEYTYRREFVAMLQYALDKINT